MTTNRIGVFISFVFTSFSRDAVPLIKKPCNFLKVDGRSMSEAQFREIRRGQTPAIVKGLLHDWPARSKGRWTLPEFKERYGNSVIDTCHVSQVNTRGEEVHPLTLAQAFDDPNRNNTLVIKPNHELVKDLARSGDWRFPRVFDKIREEGPLIALAIGKHGVVFHKHKESWAAQIRGNKRFYISTGSPDVQWDESCPHPCDLPDPDVLKEVEYEEYPRPLFQCTASPGDVVYIPDDLLHATCNEDAWNANVIHIGSIEELNPRDQAIASGDYLKLVGSFKRASHDPLALEKASHYGHLAMVGFLLSNLDDSIEQTVFRDPRPFLAAVDRGHVEITRFLLQARSNINARIANEPKGLHALHVCADRGHVHITRILVQHGADVDVLHHTKGSPLQSAALRGHSTTASVLLQMQADINARDSLSFQPIHYAAQQGHAAVARTLLNAGASPHSTNDNGQKPLHLTATFGFMRAAKVFMGSASIKDLTETITLAAQRGHQTFVNYLKRHGAILPSAVAIAGRSKTSGSARKQQAAVIEAPSAFNEMLTKASEEAMALGTTGKFAVAEQVLRKAIGKVDASPSSGDPSLQRNLLTSYYNLAVVLHGRQRYVEVEGLARHAMLGQKKMFGIKDPDTQASLELMSVTLKNLGKKDEAKHFSKLRRAEL